MFFRNDSGPKIGPDRPFVHTGPAIRTAYLVRFRSDFWTFKRAGPILKSFRSKIGSVPCETSPFWFQPGSLGFGVVFCVRTRKHDGKARKTSLATTWLYY